MPIEHKIELAKIILIIILINLLLLFLIYKLHKLKKRVYKYIPSIILFIVSLVSIFLSKYVFYSWGEVNYTLFLIIISISSIISFVVALFLDKGK